MTHPANTADLLSRAHALRRELAANRTHLQEKLQRCGRTDPIKRITGMSALDHACEEVNALIETLAASIDRDLQPSRTAHPPVVELNPIVLRNLISRVAC